MLNLFENLDRPSLDLLRSEMIAKFKIPTVVMYDDGYLPDEVDSPIKYYCKLGGNRKPMYFDQLQFPKFWRVESTGNEGKVYDIDKLRATMVYSATDNSRLVKEVHWLNDAGQIAWVDHYDRHGQRFAKTIYESGRAALRQFFDNRGRIVIVWNMIADDVFLHAGYESRHFGSYVDFVSYFLQDQHYQLDHLFINTLNRSLAVSLRLPKSGTDTIFWHEKLGNELPGNMKFVMENDSRVKHIVFERYLDWQRRSEFLPEDTGNVDVQYLGFIYPHPRGNEMRPNALTFTNSDQVEHLEELVKLLPNVHFNIAAITEMSSKLMAFQDYENVDLYPVVTKQQTQQLVDNCDVYLDINHGNEIFDAVRGAFERNMLILGFKDTIHQPDLVATANVYDSNDYKAMAQKILSALVQPKLMKQLVDTQRQEASDVTTADYQKVFGEIADELK
ncbi:accessory Sec system glycosylation chaperone GtfB [Limosilactobacillus caecicola]|uniref:accessory Sec system glycosylation chaperone GtfB n=1 Tax=Limosilactobacillus caecicola TaxID=2941332 RepID=UPI00203BA9DD|nr:accessory Sec system glycosylation chaperone GtfB [Limosilactobacillus caecicola]